MSRLPETRSSFPLRKFRMPSRYRLLILDDASADPQTVNVNGCNQIDADGDGEPDHWAVHFFAGPGAHLATSSAFFYGNVALATHGETSRTRSMGSGDASQTFQIFRPKKSPVTFVHQAGAPNGAGDTLRLLINGVYWSEVDELYGYGATTGCLRPRSIRRMIVQLGDGVTGAQAPSGKSNVLATYRQGLGVAGNVDSRHV